MNSQTLYSGSAHRYAVKQQGWQLQPERLLTMKELLEVSALEYVNVGVAIEEIRTNLAAHLAPDEPLDKTALASVTASLHRIAGHCRELGLGVSVKIVDRFLRTYAEAAPSYLQIRQEIWAFKLAFDAELEDRRFFYVPMDRAGYYTHWALFSDTLGWKIEPLKAAFEAFPSAKDEMVEAGNCLTFERPTAAVFHLMRAMEVGLKAIAKAQGVAYTSDWGTCFKHLERITRPHDPFLDEAAAHLRAVKNAWRNPTMHIERQYSEREAEAIFGVVQAFMLHLATKLTE